MSTIVCIGSGNMGAALMKGAGCAANAASGNIFLPMLILKKPALLRPT
jgi:hypothetical protein